MQPPLEEEQPVMKAEPLVEEEEEIEEENNEDDRREEEQDDDGAVEAQYAVEALRDVKRGQYKKLWFLVKWEGYPEDQNTWVVQDELQGVKDMIEEFKRAQPDLMAKVATKPRKPKAERFFVEVVKPVNDTFEDRELTDSDPFYGQQAGELKGELRGLYDPTHKMLAKLNSDQRVTRRVANSLNIPSSSGPTIDDDIFSAEDDGQEDSQDVPKVQDPLAETVRTSPKGAQKRRASDEKSSNDRETADVNQEKSVLDGSVLRKTINFFKSSAKTIAKFPEPISINTIRKYVIHPDGTKMKSISATLSQKEAELLFTRRDPKTGENWLHIMLRSNDKCDPSHELDCVLRVFAYEYGQLLNEAMPVNGYTPLHLAVDKNMGCTVRTMLCYTPNLNAKTKNDETSLAIAVRKNYPLITKFLLEAGANYTELQGKCKRESSEAAVILNQHALRFKRITDEARERFLASNNLEEMAICSSLYRHLGNTGESFQFKVPNFLPYRLPDTSFTYLLVIYICAINGESWSARCEGEFRQAAAPSLNGRPLIHVQHSYYPMVYFCPLQKGHNTVEMSGLAVSWKMYPIIAANVVLVRDRPQVIIAPVVENEIPLEYTPVIGPI